MTESVLFREQQTACGKLHIGVATLNQESTLNSLSLDMVTRLKLQLEQWRDDEQLVCVFLEGAGQKAFCAGGDVQALYRSATEQPGGPCEVAETFFDVEYRLDYLLHNYPKPVICWGHGIVMGGGLGLMAGCSHAVVTERTRLAMPEITIGLYPDVGGSWFLNKMPSNLGLFLALTGASINAHDCLLVGLSDCAILSEQYEVLLSALEHLSWRNSDQENHDLVSELLEKFAGRDRLSIPAGNLAENEAQIAQLCSGQDAQQVINNIMALESDHDWMLKARESLKAGSPLSALIIYKQLQNAADLSLAEVFQSEYLLSTNIVRYPEFAEGVRALLIDKDSSPQWQFSSIAEVPADLLDSFFTPPQSGSSWPVNPLADLAV